MNLWRWCIKRPCESHSGFSTYDLHCNTKCIFPVAPTSPQKTKHDTVFFPILAAFSNNVFTLRGPRHELGHAWPESPAHSVRTQPLRVGPRPAWKGGLCPSVPGHSPQEVWQQPMSGHTEKPCPDKEAGCCISLSFPVLQGGCTWCSWCLNCCEHKQMQPSRWHKQFLLCLVLNNLSLTATYCYRLCTYASTLGHGGKLLMWKQSKVEGKRDVLCSGTVQNNCADVKTGYWHAR